MHSRTYGYYREANLYRRLQRAGFYWPTISKEADQIQSQCEACQLPKDREESYVVFAKEDWGNPFIEYLASRTLPQKHKSRYKLKRSATCYFLHVGIQSRKGFGGDPLRCLGPKEAKEKLKEVYSRECREHQGRKKLYRYILQIGWYY